MKYPPYNINKPKLFIKCPKCSESNIVKYGTRTTKHGKAQIYFCKKCNKRFSTSSIKFITHPPGIIFTAISTYNLGHNLEQTNRIINRRFKTHIPKSTLYSWLDRYKHICTFLPLRRKYAIDPKEIIQSKRSHHQQVYEYKYHKLKLNIAGKQFPDLKAYLTSLVSGPNINNKMFREGARCSDFPGKLNVTISRIKKTANNNATKMARFGLELTRTNHERHSSVESYFLINDSATIATEIPVYLTPKEANSFNIPIPRTLTGHIDILQVRSNKIHILDYKPDAESDKSALEQLTLYAFALCTRTDTSLNKITCAYFDENSFSQFRPANTEV